VLLMVSVNEVTPLVISEAMMRGIPVITTDIAGIPSMLAHGIEGYVLPPDRHDLFVKHMEELIDNEELLTKMGRAGALRAKLQYSMSAMVTSYRRVAFALSPPVVLLGMDGCIVDWDYGFRQAWGDRSAIARTRYRMEECVDSSLKEAAMKVFHQPGFFKALPPMPGAIEALRAMEAKGLNVQICTSPFLTSPTCVQEKLRWVSDHLGVHWLKRIVITSDKTLVKGDVLIDDSPQIVGSKSPVWTQVMFDAPYNRPTETEEKNSFSEQTKKCLRLSHWNNWQEVLGSLIYFPKARGHQSKDETNWHNIC
jgi:5'-nucleotidase